MPFTFVKASRRSARRRNVPRGYHLGRGVASRTWLRTNPRRKKRGTWKKGWAAKLRTTHRSASRSFTGRGYKRKHKLNPPRRRKTRSRRRRRAVKATFPKRYRRRRSRKAKRNPYLFNRPKRRRRRKSKRPVFGRRRSRRARRNPIFVRRKRRVYRRNPGFAPRGIIGKVKAAFREILSLDTGRKVVAATAGASAALWGPKLLGFKVNPKFGRGWGGVATSVATTAVVGGLVAAVSPKDAKPFVLGGLFVAFLGALSAISCKFRMTVVPIETGLIACSLPTSPASQTPSDAARAAALVQALASAGAPTGVRGLAGTVNQIVSGEAAMRRAIGVGEYIGTGAGLGDFTQFQTETVPFTPSSGESF